MTLFVVSTPIGNLEDITLRAVRVLKESALIACEDTRRTRKLLNHYQVRTPVVSYHAHSLRRRTEEILNMLHNGRDVALVSDNGTPGISDPGFVLVNEAHQRDIPVRIVPGPSAVTAACAGAGLPADRFVFLGFLPRRIGRARRLLMRAAELDETVVLYESPHRVQKTLSLMQELFGREVLVAIARELTKIHEEIIRGTPDALISRFDGRKVRGEVVMLFNPSGKSRTESEI